MQWVFSEGESGLLMKPKVRLFMDSRGVQTPKKLPKVSQIKAKNMLNTMTSKKRSLGTPDIKRN